jgi:AraC family transcriptional regulator
MLSSHASFGGTVIRRASAGDGLFSETSHPALTTLEEHAHARASLCLVVAGEFTEHSSSGRITHRPDDVIFRPAEGWHSDEFSERGARCFNVELSTELLHEARSGELDNRQVVAQLLRKMRRELRDGSNAPLVLEGLLYQIVGEAFQRKPREHTPRWIREVEDILRRRFSERLTVRSIAADVGVHPVHLARAFRAARGMTIADSLLARRIEVARRLLERSSLPLVEVALEAGFADQSHFTKSFRRIVGVTPMRYRISVIPSAELRDAQVIRR